jgi:4-amino-4-deoxy-L-arabinose transferase-like glycosyltransferase
LTLAPRRSPAGERVSFASEGTTIVGRFMAIDLDTTTEPARLAGRPLAWRAAAVAGALVGVLALAAWLRLRGIGWGLPYSYQDPDERVVLAHAFRMSQGHLDPGFFLYPSLLFEVIGGIIRLVALAYAPHGLSLTSTVAFVTDPTPYYLIGRGVAAVCGVVSVYLVYRLGHEAYSRPVGLVAAAFLAVVPLAVRYSHQAVTDMPATMLGLLALLLFLRAARRRDARTLAIAAVVAGLATGTKYNLGMLIVPGLVACWYVWRDEPLRRWLRALPRRSLGRLVAPMLLAYLLSTPFTLLDPHHFVTDFARQNRIVASGWLGFEHVHDGYWYNLSVNLVSSLGIVLLALGIAGLVLALVRRRPADVMLASFTLVYYLYVSSWHELMDRYLLPIVPLLVVFAVRLCVDLAGVQLVRRRLVVAVAAGALLVGAVASPARASIAYSQSLHGTDVRSVAKAWLERHLPVGAVIAEEPYGPPLVTVADLPYYRAARLSPPAYTIYSLPLPLPGARDPGDRLKFLVAHRVTYVVLSSAVDRRVLAARATYPAQVAFYETLARRTQLVATFAPHAGESGPVITVYRLPASLERGRHHKRAR